MHRARQDGGGSPRAHQQDGTATARAREEVKQMRAAAIAIAIAVAGVSHTMGRDLQEPSDELMQSMVCSAFSEALVWRAAIKGSPDTGEPMSPKHMAMMLDAADYLLANAIN